MPIIDFKEIPSAKPDKAKPGEQDTFELFSRDFLEMLGYVIISSPNRGPDLGKDVVVKETRRGVGGETHVKWLVSCKHYAHTGISISPEIEHNIVDRVKANKCDGFIGVYSTIPSSGLIAILEGLEGIEQQTFDKERIEKYILGSSDGMKIAKRYFPTSVNKWQNDRPRPADIMVKIPPLLCAYTGEDLLKPKPRGIIVFGMDRNFTIEGKKHCEDIYWSLKGEPDRALEQQFRKRNLMTLWEDIPDVVIPTVFIRWCIAPLNKLRSGQTYSDVAFDKLRTFIITVFPYVARDMSDDERKRVQSLLEIPAIFGGLSG